MRRLSGRHNKRSRKTRRGEPLAPENRPMRFVAYSTTRTMAQRRIVRDNQRVQNRVPNTRIVEDVRPVADLELEDEESANRRCKSEK